MCDCAKAHGPLTSSCEILGKLRRTSTRAIETRLKFDFSGLIYENSGAKKREGEKRGEEEEKKKRKDKRKRSRG